jgi:predicted glycoside hydrolase/deacetylase ChbG (UPF0249 family)
LWKFSTGELTPTKVEADWNNQIKKFKKIFGKNPDGINSHEHIHFFPPFFKVATKLQQKYSIPYLRFGDSISMPQHNTVAHILNFLRILNKKTFLKSTATSSQSLLSLDWINDCEKFIDDPPEGTIEVATHPELAEDFVKIKTYF